jgi:hypothetical protein
MLVNFQRSENIRTARQLAPMFVLQFVNFLVNNFPTVLIYFNLVPNIYTRVIWFAVVCILNAFINIAIEMMLVM